VSVHWAPLAPYQLRYADVEGTAMVAQRGRGAKVDPRDPRGHGSHVDH
jgi:hypothetical protein